jgi:hypothetical protein
VILNSGLLQSDATSDSPINAALDAPISPPITIPPLLNIRRLFSVIRELAGVVKAVAYFRCAWVNHTCACFGAVLRSRRQLLRTSRLACGAREELPRKQNEYLGDVDLTGYSLLKLGIHDEWQLRSPPQAATF